MRKHKKLWSSLFLLLVLTVIWGNSTLPGDESSALSGGLLAWLRSVFPFLSGLMEYDLRKIAHFSEFALLAASLAVFCTAWDFSGKYLIVPFGGLFAACVDETIQVFSPGRYSSLIDVWIDFSGCITGFLFFLLITLVLHRKK